MNEDLRALLEKVWDEGEDAGYINSASSEWPEVEPVENPYRHEGGAA